MTSGDIVSLAIDECRGLGEAAKEVVVDVPSGVLGSECSEDDTRYSDREKKAMINPTTLSRRWLHGQMLYKIIVPGR